MNATYSWYQQLLKPSWAPPSYLFGPVWTVLYMLIAISFGFVFFHVYKKKLPRTIAVPFILNLVCNALFSPIQFGLQNNLLAAVDIILVLGTLLWAMNAIRRLRPWVAYIQIPYLLWVTFATALQLTVTYLNW